jgi:hypothetical protein
MIALDIGYAAHDRRRAAARSISISSRGTTAGEARAACEKVDAGFLRKRREKQGIWLSKNSSSGEQPRTREMTR